MTSYTLVGLGEEGGDGADGLRAEATGTTHSFQNHRVAAGAGA